MSEIGDEIKELNKLLSLGFPELFLFGVPDGILTVRIKFGLASRIYNLLFVSSFRITTGWRRP